LTGIGVAVRRGVGSEGLGGHVEVARIDAEVLLDLLEPVGLHQADVLVRRVGVVPEEIITIVVQPRIDVPY
jgi:hypothetical protein